MEDLNFLIAVIAGCISFFAPCSIVLIPAFFAQITGVAISDLHTTSQKIRWDVFLSTLFFILGFTLIFTLLGASVGVVSQTLFHYSNWISRISGVLIIIFGLHILGYLEFNLPTMQFHILSKNKFGLFTSFLIGTVFALSWTPCVGPILSSILLLASNSSSVYNSLLLLFGYSIGLMIPFTITSLCIGWIFPKLKAFSKYFFHIHRFTGVILIALGILVFTNNLSKIVGYLFFI